MRVLPSAKSCGRGHLALRLRFRSCLVAWLCCVVAALQGGSHIAHGAGREFIAEKQKRRPHFYGCRFCALKKYPKICYNSGDNRRTEGTFMRDFYYTKLKDRTWDSEILGYVAQIHEYNGHQQTSLKQLCADRRPHEQEMKKRSWPTGMCWIPSMKDMNLSLCDPPIFFSFIGTCTLIPKRYWRQL